MWQARASISAHNRPSPPPWGGGNWREPKLRWRGWQWGLRAQYVRASANNTFSPHNRLLHHLLLILVTGVFEAVTVQPGGWQRELEDEDDLYKKEEEEHFSLSRSCVIDERWETSLWEAASDTRPLVLHLQTIIALRVPHSYFSGAWVARPFLVCEWVRYRCHPTKSPLFSMSKGI